ncbi:MAG: sporulation transcription factor Spo0A [Christensenellaceae bacterium]|jgi:two-component system response regulator (stage 0 sporulation protein A)|nr:sporulation transcription factor Spo0A [Christensenellaceae bacterium]
MESKRVILVDDSAAVRELLENALKERPGMEVAGSVGNGAAALEILQERPADVLVTDLVMPIMDGFTLIENIQRLPGKKPKIVVLTALMRDDFIQRAVGLGADYYMLKPFDAEVICQRIADLFAPSASLQSLPSPIQAVTHSLDERIANIFLSMGIPAHIKGYHFLREAIKTVVETPETINAITKELYPSVARRFNTSASKVERAIRHAIDVAWTRGQVENINQLFGSRIYLKTDKPTNGEFIALIADRLVIERSA